MSLLGGKRQAGQGRVRDKSLPRWRLLGFACAALLASGVAYAGHLPNDTEGHTSVEQVLVGEGNANFEFLDVQEPGEPYVVRSPQGLGQLAEAGRETRRTSLAYFAQLTDFQLADEESPARVEFADPGASSAWRPQEAFTAFEIDATVRQINQFADESPVSQGNGSRAPMGLTLVTGDQADNQQRNETLWVRDLLEGGTTMNLNSGSSNPLHYASSSCEAAIAPGGPGLSELQAEAPKYTGVQDYSDYEDFGFPPGEGPQNLYYDPDEPEGQYANWPTWMGLMDRAQQLSFTPAGLDVPWYVANGNHDVLVQGNEDAARSFEDLAVGCMKILASSQEPDQPQPDPGLLLEPPAAFMLVPPDPQRQFVDKTQIKDIYGEHDFDSDHGFGFVDPAENTASNGAASYYAWDPPEAPGFRFVSIDTNSEGGVVEQSSNGNIDDPQFQWLESELQAAQAADKLIVIFGHHPVRSMNSNIRDEQAGQCVGNDDAHGHNQAHPGCDIDPRSSEPIHLGTPGAGATAGESFVELLARYDNVIAYVAGHTHENDLRSFSRPNASAWWEVNTSSVVDHPQQSRLVEVMDNEDGTLSIFGTIVDHASPSTAPGEDPEPGDDTTGPDVQDFGVDELASIGRTLAWNDPQNNESGEGSAQDRNAELLLPDPRTLPPNPPADGGAQRGRCGGRTATLVGTAGGERLVGTPKRDVIAAGGGSDKVFGRGGKDVLCGGRGRDNLRGGRGRDRLLGGWGNDRLLGGPAADLLRGQRGPADVLRGGGGRDRCFGAGPKGRRKSC